MASDGERCVARPRFLQWSTSSSLLLAQRSNYHRRFVLRATDRRERYLHHTRKPAVQPSPHGLRRSVCVFRESLENTAVVVVVVAATTFVKAVVVTAAVMARFVIVGFGGGCYCFCDDGRTRNQYWKTAVATNRRRRSYYYYYYCYYYYYYHQNNNNGEKRTNKWNEIKRKLKKKKTHGDEIITTRDAYYCSLL